MSAEALRIAIACEDQAHRALATFLADRVLLDEAALREADWFNDESIHWYRSYRGLEGGDEDDTPSHRRFCSLTRATKEAAEFGARARIGGRAVKLHGHIDGKPCGPEALSWRKVFVLFGRSKPPPDVLIVVRDTDGKDERRRGLRQALADHKGFPVITATPHQEAEAWFVAGFVPQDEAERGRLEKCKRVLGFYPTEEPHRLTAGSNKSPADAKRVLQLLVYGEDESSSPGLDALPRLCERTLSDLTLLERRGAGCLLAEFLRELRQILAPIVIDGTSRRPG